jgi:hypothetical protein
LIAERLLRLVDGHTTVYLRGASTAADLIVRNGANDGSSRVAIYGVRLVQFPSGVLICLGGRI